MLHANGDYPAILVSLSRLPKIAATFDGYEYRREFREEFFARCDLSHTRRGHADLGSPRGQGFINQSGRHRSFHKIRTIRSIRTEDSFATMALSNLGERDERRRI
jgi:hypothetical protein